MDIGERFPAVQDVRSQLEAFTKRVDEDPEFSRRVFIKGVGALSLLTFLQGVSALRILGADESGESVISAAGDACAEAEAACLDQPIMAGEQRALLPAETTLPPPTTSPPETVPPTTTTAPPPPPPPPPPPTVVMKSAESSEWELPAAERRRMPYEEFASNSELMISKLPTLEALQVMFPSAFFNDVEGQKRHIAYLDESVHLDPEEFRRFGFDTSRANAFSAEAMASRMLIWHWTGDHYETPDDIIRVLANRGLGVQGYCHHDHLAYRFVPDLGMAVGHSLGLNDFAMGLEVYSGTYDGVRSPLFSFTPEVTKTGLYASVSMFREKNLPINFATFMSHMAGDLIFVNPYYDPYTGTFHPIPGHKPPHVRKFDQPQEFMQMVVPKAQALDAALGPR
jgi:hypothetical protein